MIVLLAFTTTVLAHVCVCERERERERERKRKRESAREREGERGVEREQARERERERERERDHDGDGARLVFRLGGLRTIHQKSTYPDVIDFNVLCGTQLARLQSQLRTTTVTAPGTPSEGSGLHLEA